MLALAVSESELSLFNGLRRDLRVTRAWAFERERTLDGRRKPARLKFLARPRNSGKSVIAVELADDPDHAIDGLEVRSLCGGVHRADKT